MTFALIASLMWGTTPTAWAQSAANDASLSTLSLHESAGNGFMNMFFPQLGDRITLTPAFTEEVTSYTATIRYDVTSFLLVASRSHPDTTLEVTGIGADGAPLEIVASIGSFNATFEETEIRAGTLRSFKQVPLGNSTITVEATSEDGSTTRTTTVTVVRLDPDLNAEKERDLFFLASIRNEDADGVQRAIQAGANVSTWHDVGGKTQYANPLRMAVGKENAALVQLLLQAGADVNDVHPEGDGISPLMLASQRGHEVIVRLLLDAGADVNHTVTDIGKNSPAGASALILAIDKGHTGTARLLLEAGADPNPHFSDSSRRSDGGLSALMFAVDRKNEEIVRLLIKAGADVNYIIPGERPMGKNPKTAGLTALLSAVVNNHEEIVRLLIEAGANINYTLPDQGFPAHGEETGGISVLMVAINKGNEKMARVLIEAGADVNYIIPGERPMGKNPKTAGLTALRIAKAQDREKIVARLREAGAKD